MQQQQLLLPPSRVLVATVNTRPIQQNAFLLNWSLALSRLGYPHRILGQGEKWQGWMWRCAQYRSFLDALDPEDVVICQDSDDMLPLRPYDPQRLVALTLTRHQRPLVFGMQIFGTPSSLGYVPKLDKPAWYCTLNMGCVIGRVWALRALYTWILDNFPEDADDQTAAAAFSYQFPELCALDTESALVNNLGNTWVMHPDQSDIFGPSHFLHFYGRHSNSRMTYVVFYRQLLRELLGDGNYIEPGDKAPSNNPEEILSDFVYSNISRLLSLLG